MLKHPLMVWQELASNWTGLFLNFGKSVLLLQIGASLEHLQSFRPRLATRQTAGGSAVPARRIS